MKAILCLIIILTTTTALHAQDFEGDARRIMDSIIDHSNQDSIFANSLPSDKDYFIKLEDSLAKGFAVQHLQQLVSNDKYSWPFWYLQSMSRLPPKKTDAIPYPTETGKYLLKSKYNVDMHGVSNGCLWQRTFVLHDSLMFVAIKKRWGEDFFSRYTAEADAMDKKGKGLLLPVIKHKNTTKSLYQKFAYADTAKALTGDYRPPLYLIIEFNGDTVKNAYWGEDFLGMAQFSMSRFKPTEQLTEKIQSLEWQGPRFHNTPVTAKVYFDFTKRSLQFLKL